MPSTLTRASATLLGKIGFQGHFDGGRSDVYAIKPDGTGLEQLTEHPADDVSPVVSPDGSRIAFMNDRWKILTVARDGSGLVALFDERGLRRYGEDPASGGN